MVQCESDESFSYAILFPVQYCQTYIYQLSYRNLRHMTPPAWPGLPGNHYASAGVPIAHLVPLLPQDCSFILAYNGTSHAVRGLSLLL